LHTELSCNSGIRGTAVPVISEKNGIYFKKKFRLSTKVTQQIGRRIDPLDEMPLSRDSEIWGWKTQAQGLVPIRERIWV
jgi:hypothetical protein